MIRWKNKHAAKELAPFSRLAIVQEDSRLSPAAYLRQNMDVVPFLLLLSTAGVVTLPGFGQLAPLNVDAHSSSHLEARGASSQTPTRAGSA